jgi:pimeloyl-ACP methyl ester carboxylesterase
MEEKSLFFREEYATYYTVGEGATVCLLHGFGEDASFWLHQISALQSHYRLILPDWPGSGKSGYNAGLKTIEEYAELLHAILAVEGISTVILLGHSMGGYIALAFAEKFPGYVVGLGLIHSTAFADTPAKIATREKSIAFIEAQGAGAFLQTAIPGLFAPAFAKDHPGVVDYWITRGLYFAADSLVQYYRAMMARPDRTKVLAGSTVPVLLLAGALDQAVPLGDVLEQAALAGQTSIHILREVGHMGPLEATTAVNDCITDFLQLCVGTK